MKNPPGPVESGSSDRVRFHIISVSFFSVETGFRASPVESGCSPVESDIGIFACKNNVSEQRPPSNQILECVALALPSIYVLGCDLLSSVGPPMRVLGEVIEL